MKIKIEDIEFDTLEYSWKTIPSGKELITTKVVGLYIVFSQSRLDSKCIVLYEDYRCSPPKFAEKYLDTEETNHFKDLVKKLEDEAKDKKDKRASRTSKVRI